MRFFLGLVIWWRLGLLLCFHPSNSADAKEKNRIKITNAFLSLHISSVLTEGLWITQPDAITGEIFLTFKSPLLKSYPRNRKAFGLCLDCEISSAKCLISDKNVIHLWCLDTWARTWKSFWHIKQIKSNGSILFELSDYGINLNYKSLWVLIRAVPTFVTIALHRAGAWLLLLPFSPLVNLRISNVVPCLSALMYVPVKCGRWRYALSCWANSQYKGNTGTIN